MKLILLYGPPASGKLTIAEKLAETTNIPLFHNHLSRDLVKSIYNDNLRDHYDLVDKIRFDVLDHCAKHQTDLIFTYVYAGPNDDLDIKNFIRIIESNGGQIQFVELTADRQDLIDRADNESRKRFKKLVDPVKMSKVTEDMAIYTIPFVDTLKIDTSVTNPQEAVKLITEKLYLQ